MGHDGGGRRLLHDRAGCPVLSFVERTRDGRRWAQEVTVLCAGASDAVFSQLSGWCVQAGVELADTLLAGGARLIWHGHRMSRDLRADPPPADWACPCLPLGVRLTGFDRPVEEIAAVREAAFRPGQADRACDPGRVAEVARRLAEVFAGGVLGPMSSSSALAVDGADRVVGAVAVFARPVDGAVLPWVGTVFRRPGADLRGLGGGMLRSAVAGIAADGAAAIALAVTEGNPARGLYERLGFQIVSTTMSVQIP